MGCPSPLGTVLLSSPTRQDCRCRGTRGKVPIRQHSPWAKIKGPNYLKLVSPALVMIFASSEVLVSTKTSATPCSLISPANQKYGRVSLDEVLLGLHQQLALLKAASHGSPGAVCLLPHHHDHRLQARTSAKADDSVVDEAPCTHPAMIDIAAERGRVGTSTSSSAVCGARGKDLVGEKVSSDILGASITHYTMIP